MNETDPSLCLINPLIKIHSGRVRIKTPAKQKEEIKLIYLIHNPSAVDILKSQIITVPVKLTLFIFFTLTLNITKVFSFNMKKKIRQFDEFIYGTENDMFHTRRVNR
jgi:hypothetical protein